MSFAPDAFTSDSEKTLAKPEVLLRVPVGLSSPLWGLFAGAAMSGAAWWWMTRWARPENLEAMFGAAAKFEAAVEPKVVELAAPMVEAAEAAPETALDTEAAPEVVPEAAAAAEPVFEAVAEAAQEPVLEALIEAPAAPEPVGGEAAPISPVLEAFAPEIAAEAAAAAKPKKAPAPRPA